MSKIKSIDLGMIDDNANAISLNIPIASIYSLHIAGITSSVAYMDGSDGKEFDEQLSFNELELSLYKNSIGERLLLKNPFIISLILYLDDDTEIFYDVPYKPSNDESGTNILQSIIEEKLDGKDIIRILINDM